MDTEARIEAAKARLEENRAVLVMAKEAGPACTWCRWFIPEKVDAGAGRPTKREGPYCGHLAYSQQSFDPVAGRISEAVHVPATTARAPDGLCGTEAVLYEPVALFNPPTLKAVGSVTLKGVIYSLATVGLFALGYIVDKL